MGWGFPCWDLDHFLDVSRNFKLSEARKQVNCSSVESQSRGGAFMTLKHIQGIFKMGIPQRMSFKNRLSPWEFPFANVILR